MKEFWQQCEGQIIDGFPLRRYLGGGENHAVFLTEYGSESPQRAAIKVMHADPDTTEDRLRRWRLASELMHPNLLRLYERGHWELNNVPVLYLVMEFAEENLSQVIPQRALTADEAREMLDPALGALAYLHSKGFVHGDLKPSNLQAAGNQVKLSSDSVSQIGETRFTPADDVWSLGMTLVEALTRQLPAWSASDAADPSLPATLPSEFHEITRNMLRRDPQSRWTVAQTQAWLHGKPGAARKQAYAVAAALVLILLAMVAGTRMIRKSESKPAPQPAQQATPPAVAQSKPSPLSPPSEAERKPLPPSPPAREAKPSPETEPEKSTSPLLPASGDVVRKVMPDILPRARSSIQGRVALSVRVEVDPSGKVSSASIESRGPSRYFAERAVEAARRWQFSPGSGKRAWRLRFVFTRGGTKVAPEKLGS